jgi:predicted ATPase
LTKLVEAELLYQRGLPPQAHYLFKHALIQDTAYQSLLKSTRQQYHRQIAQVLAERFPETVETQPELVAHHYTEAGLRAQALPYWQKAGERATQRSAYVEAVAHLTKGLELLQTLPDTPERVQQELTLQLALNDALVTVKGYTAPEVEKTVTRARELCQQLGETPQLFPMLRRLFSFYFNRLELQTARELAEQEMRLAQSIQDSYLLSVAHQALGITLCRLGALASARLHLAQAIALYDPQTHPRSTFGSADLRVDCLCFASSTLWHLGYPEQALQRSQEAVALAAGLSHPFSLATTLGHAALLNLFRRDEQVARERAEAVMTLSTEQGFPFWLAWGTILRGGALAAQGQGEEGLAQLRQGLAARRVMGAERLPYFLALLAEVYRQGGQAEEGLAVLAEALATVDKTGERFCEAELCRLKGELLLTQEGLRLQAVGHREKIEEAEACFHKAIEIARRQQAKSWELRAVMSMSRLWQRQGKKDEARQMLAGIYGWFTEGFDTKDLQEAKALLEELSH